MGCARSKYEIPKNSEPIGIKDSSRLLLKPRTQVTQDRLLQKRSPHSMPNLLAHISFLEPYFTTR